MCISWCFFDSPYIEKYLVNYFWLHRCYYKSQTDCFPIIWMWCIYSWNLFKVSLSGRSSNIKENSIFHCVSLVFHRLKSILWIIYVNMDPFMQSVLGELEWKIIKIKQNIVFHGVSLIFHTLKSILWIFSGNMDGIIKVKDTVLIQF